MPSSRKEILNIWKLVDQFLVSTLNSNVEASIPEARPTKAPRNDYEEIDISSLERDPGLRPPIWKYPVNQQDEIRRAYMKAGPYQTHFG